MCGIIHLKPGVMIPEEMLENLCWNNWHSYGLVTMKPKGMDIIRKVPESGEVDPYEVQDLLLKNKEFERFLHVRHNTAGATTLENTHPFDVYKDKKREVVFMHNGTLYEYKSKTTNSLGTTIDDDTGPSDTKNFVDQILTPYLTAMDFGKGKGDIESYHAKRFINKFWPTGNRGLLISSDQPAVFLGDWKKMTTDGVEWLASNDDYFDKLKRGPEFDRREKAAEEEKRAAAARFQATARSNLTTNPAGNAASEQLRELKEFTFGKKHPFFDLSSSMVNLVNDWDIYDRASAVSLGCASVDELAQLYKSEKDCLFVMDWIFTDYYNLYQDHLKLEQKLNNATKLIATLKVKEVEEKRAM